MVFQSWIVVCLRKSVMTDDVVPLDLGCALQIGLAGTGRCCGVGGGWVAAVLDLHGLAMSRAGRCCHACGGRGRRGRTRSENRSCRGLGVGQTSAVHLLQVRLATRDLMMVWIR